MAKLTKAKPTVDETPRDSLTAHMMSWPATLVAVVVGRAVGFLLADLDANGEEICDEILDNFRAEGGMVVMWETRWMGMEESCLAAWLLKTKTSQLPPPPNCLGASPATILENF